MKHSMRLAGGAARGPLRMPLVPTSSSYGFSNLFASISLVGSAGAIAYFTQDSPLPEAASALTNTSVASEPAEEVTKLASHHIEGGNSKLSVIFHLYDSSNPQHMEFLE